MIDGSVRTLMEYLPSPLVEVNTVVRHILVIILEVTTDEF